MTDIFDVKTFICIAVCNSLLSSCICMCCQRIKKILLKLISMKTEYGINVSTLKFELLVGDNQTVEIQF